MSKLLGWLNIFKAAAPVANMFYKWIFPNNNFHPVRALYALLGFLMMILSVHFIGLEETEAAAEMTQEYIIPALGKFDAELQPNEQQSVTSDTKQQEINPFIRDNSR